MANPDTKILKEKIVHKVATAVTDGTIKKHPQLSRNVAYIGTYRLTGGDAPTVDEILSEGILMFQDNPEEEEISLQASSDIYIYCNFENNTDDDVGRLTVCV